MTRSGGQSEARPPVFKPSSKLGTHLSTHCSIYDVKDAYHTGRPIVENFDKITEIFEVDRHVSSRSIAHKLKINHKTVLNHLRKVGFKKKLDVWVPP
ncbi:histone-lysine N-methyltransferase SETMAR [Trichonephila clavipes]|nr:histone-lysine N-methyltransferase SETMAR [Trichonephila clavipes]